MTERLGMLASDSPPLCGRCGSWRPSQGYAHIITRWDLEGVTCIRVLGRSTRSEAKGRAARERARRERREIGMCQSCPDDAQPGRTRCLRCGKRNALRSRQRTAKVKP